MFSDEDRAWLKALHGDLWPPKDTRGPFEKLLDAKDQRALFPNLPVTPAPPEPREKITHEELQRVLGLIESAGLMTNIIPMGHFGTVALTVYEHELFPGTGCVKLLTLFEEHLPNLVQRSWYQHLLGVEKKLSSKSSGGRGRDDVWELFTKFAHSEKNLGWLKMYKIEARLDRTYYDY